MNRLKWFLAVLPAGLAVFMFARAQPTTPNSASATNPLPASVHARQAPGLENFYQLGSNIYSGSAPEGDAGFAALKALGIKTIITVDGAKPDVATARRFGLRYVHLPFGYDGVPLTQGLRLVKAVETLPGPVYIHCHHGLHRGPAGVAVVCMATEGWTADQAVAWLHQAGTATNYAGLYRSVAAFHPPTADALQSVTNDFPETSPVSALADVMLEIDARMDNVKLTQKAGYQAPSTHPDLAPENEALLLHELLKELVRSPLAEERSQDFRDKLVTAEEAANSYHLSLLITPFDPKRSDATLLRLNTACAACHQAYRN
jgi:protein tyrosine phosphatase (PTP) superfamily phosphohydrolase (DUF442 family)